jgi:hypothetical protein
LFAILKSYRERNSAKQIKNPFPPIKSTHLEALKNASIKDLTQRGIVEEAKLAEAGRLKRKGTKTPTPNPAENVPANKKPGNKNQIVASIAKQVLKCDDIDDVFWVHYQSSDDETENVFAEQAVRLNKQTGQIMTYSESIKE